MKMKNIASVIAVFLIIGLISGCTKSSNESEFIITEDDKTEFRRIIEEGDLMGVIMESEIIEYDVTEDGFPDLCAGISKGSGIVSCSIVVYDVYNHNFYELDERMRYDYLIDSVENDGIYIRRWKWQSNDESSLGVLKFEDGELKFSEISN